MGKIELLARETIDKIAAGEVVERPKSVVQILKDDVVKVLHSICQPI